MAAHIDSVATSGIQRVTKGDFYAKVLPGDLLFCSGRSQIDHVIQGETHSPWSHVLMAWLPGAWAGMWLTIEATLERGVHVGLLSDYVDGYDGDVVLARRPALSLLDVYNELAHGFTLLDDRYDWQQEVSIAARKLVRALPLLQPKGELYCSGLQYVMSLATKYPLKKPLASFPTPEDNWTDPTVESCSGPRRQ